MHEETRPVRTRQVRFDVAEETYVLFKAAILLRRNTMKETMTTFMEHVVEKSGLKKGD